MNRQICWKWSTKIPVFFFKSAAQHDCRHKKICLVIKNTLSDSIFLFYQYVKDFSIRFKIGRISVGYFEFYDNSEITVYTYFKFIHLVYSFIANTCYTYIHMCKSHTKTSLRYSYYITNFDQIYTMTLSLLNVNNN